MVVIIVAVCGIVTMSFGLGSMMGGRGVSSESLLAMERKKHQAE